MFASTIAYQSRGPHLYPKVNGHVRFTATSILTARERIEYHGELIVMYLPDATPRDLPDKVRNTGCGCTSCGDYGRGMRAMVRPG